MPDQIHDVREAHDFGRVGFALSALASGVALGHVAPYAITVGSGVRVAELDLSSCSPKVVRPAGDETGVEWRGAAGSEVGLRLGAREPVFQLDPGPLEHPRLCHGRSPGPEHAC